VGDTDNKNKPCIITPVKKIQKRGYRYRFFQIGNDTQKLQEREQRIGRSD
jgi:hypothetical protein